MPRCPTKVADEEAFCSPRHVMPRQRIDGSDDHLVGNQEYSVPRFAPVELIAMLYDRMLNLWEGKFKARILDGFSEQTMPTMPDSPNRSYEAIDLRDLPANCSSSCCFYTFLHVSRMEHCLECPNIFLLPPCLPTTIAVWTDALHGTNPRTLGSPLVSQPMTRRT